MKKFGEGHRFWGELKKVFRVLQPLNRLQLPPWMLKTFFRDVNDSGGRRREGNLAKLLKQRDNSGHFEVSAKTGVKEID